MLDSVRFNIINRNDEMLAYSRDYAKRFSGPNKQSIIRSLREELEQRHRIKKKKRLVYTKANIKKEPIES